MDETIEILSEKMLNSISGYSLPDQSYILLEVADRLRAFASECLQAEYGTDNNEDN